MSFRRIFTRVLLGLLLLVGLFVVIIGCDHPGGQPVPDQRVRTSLTVTYPGPDGITLHAYHRQAVERWPDFQGSS